MKSSNPQTLEKRKIPKFQHLPAVQAAKAKRAWVEKVKLKSQWSKQKRKLSKDNQNRVDDDDETLRPLKAEAQEEEDGKESDDSTKNQQEVNEKRTSKPRQASSSRMPEKQQKKPRSEAEAQDIQRLRDLTRQAYSRKSLHTFKSDPLNRRKGHRKEGGNTGKGQPNMKLRMNALLEKIKIDVGEQ